MHFERGLLSVCYSADARHQRQTTDPYNEAPNRFGHGEFPRSRTNPIPGSMYVPMRARPLAEVAKVCACGASATLVADAAGRVETIDDLVPPVEQ